MSELISGSITAAKSVLAGMTNLFTTAVLKERLALLNEHLAAAEKESRKTASDLAEAKREIAELTKKVIDPNQSLKIATAKNEFTEHRGAYFRRARNGKWSRTVYCGRCQTSAAALEDFGGLISCGPCDWLADFNVRDLDEVIRELGE